MDPVTHVATGVLISQLLPLPSRFWGAVAGAAFALMPDLDYFWGLNDRLAFIRLHRGFTHSLAALPVLALLGAGINAAIGGKAWFRPFFILGVAVLASHLLLDLATSYGTQILAPFSSRKFNLDWLFIIDPFFTLVLILGVMSGFIFPAVGKKLAGGFLTAAGLYFLLCGGYHRQALATAQTAFAPEVKQGWTVAALPQPFFCWRWQLLAAGPEEVKQAMVALPLPPWTRPQVQTLDQEADPDPGLCPRAPLTPYQPPQGLIVQVWPASRQPPLMAPEARGILEAYLEFARFPLRFRVEPRGEEVWATWLDLRFTVPGRSFPFILQMALDRQGALHHWSLGRCVETTETDRMARGF